MKGNQLRELFVVTGNSDHFRDGVEDELSGLHHLLNSVENTDQFCIAHEIIDLNNYKIITHRGRIKKIALQKEMKPFVFFSNKN
jgi:hypothetical protein